MRRELSYQFDLDIERVHLIINMKCDVQVWWKSGKRKIATKNSLKLTGTQKYFDVRQKLSIIAKIGVENGVLQQKKTQLLIILFTNENTSKLGGRVYLNLAQFISSDNLTAAVIRKCERSLQNCPDEASKIVFNLSCKYIEESVGGIGSENINDISFQANNFSSSVGTASSFGKTVDMTFRPQKEQYNQKWNNLNSGSYQSNQNIRQNQHSPREKKRVSERQWEKQKILDTPSWDRASYRQKQPFDPPQATQNVRAREKQQQKINSSGVPQRPLQFSFNPMNASDRQKLGLDNSEIIRDLKQIVEQRGQTIRSLQEQLSKIRIQNEEKSEKSSAKSISLLNQLNSVNVLKEQLQRQKLQLLNQNEQIKEENKRLEQKLKSTHFQYSEVNNEYMNKLEQRKKIIEELNLKLEECDKRANKYQDELFKRENEIITKQKQFIASQTNKQSINKQQTEKLKSISAALKELQTNFEKVFAQKQQLKRKFEQNNYKLQKIEDVNTKLCQNLQKAESQNQKYLIIEGKYKAIIEQIESEYKKFSVEKLHMLKQKDQQISSLRQKFNLACKKMQQVSSSQQSLKNTISQKNIRIKSLQQICSQLQKQAQQKQQLITKAKQYIKSKQQELSQKNSEIERRDELIQKCRAYMQHKQKQYNEFMNGVKNNSSVEKGSLKKELKDKETMLQDYITQQHKMEKQIEEMVGVIEQYKSRLGEYENEIEELQRKHESQEGTLKELVKKNLDMEIQLNIKDYQIQALKSNR